MKNSEEQQSLLKPFSKADIEFRVNRVSRKTQKVCVLAYITARGIMKRLDEVFGLAGWKDEYQVLDNGVKCRLSVKIDSEWVTKEDVAPFTNIEALKGAFSDSLKRAGVKFGIGRYLYDLREYWVDILAERPADRNSTIHYHSSGELTGYWVEPLLPEWALPDVKAQIPNEFKDKLDSFLSSKLITKDIYEHYVKMLSNSKTSTAEKGLIRSQLNLISLWAKNIYNDIAIDTNQKRILYKKIINSNSQNLESVSSEILSYCEVESDLEVA